MIVSKAIPRAADTTSKERRDMKADREIRYPNIHAIDPGSGFGALSAGPDDPTDEDLWGDPVNLAYPLAYIDQTVPDKDRADNARVRFIQNQWRQYDPKSSAAVYERIVRAQLAAGSSPSYKPERELDLTLPDDVVDRMEKSDMTSDFHGKVAAFRKRVSPEHSGSAASDSEPGPLDLLHKAVAVLADTSSKERAQIAHGLLTRALKAIVHDGSGNPRDVGLILDDRSKDPNFSPSAPSIATTHPEQRGFWNPLRTGEIASMTDSKAPDPVAPPAMTATPGPRVSEPLFGGTSRLMSEPGIPAARTGHEVAGVTKSEPSFIEFLAQLPE